ncbi:DUF2254 domain-containing protein [Hansschlegelia sp.]|uniref:DUF2254 domain-containing protein n=1 Tax=Hansschlegelia sp. TaxID=2041892 RepID=UPI002CC4EE70|nr:DUF2254 domain-containing protein [Hansschlegelia sp.]HVI30038.1 DUF2254 domain-containing protein [Hansschlegelia sp.]
MTSRWLWLLSRLGRRIWFRASLFSLAAVLTALLAIVIAPLIPMDVPAKVGADSVDNILGIIASSMLAVTTFSLNVMVSAYSAATTNVTPRATRLVMEDSTTQNVLATFLGSFLFSLVGIVALSTGAYGDQGRVVLLGVTIVIIVLIVVTLLRWIDHLSKLGRVTETTARVEEVAATAMRDRQRRPYLGGVRLDSQRIVPTDARPIAVDRIGYVQHVDVGELSSLAEAVEGRIYLGAIPGMFAEPARPLAWTVGLSQENDEAVRRCFSVGDTRSFDQDPRFGLCVLSEIASRALSPGINDPGTAIDVIGRAVRVLALWSSPEAKPEIAYPRVFVPGIEPDDLFSDVFQPLGRDGAGLVEVGLRLQKALHTLARLGDGRYAAPARRQSALALARAEAALVIEDDVRQLREAAARV